jgi:hypothetical protein
MATYNACQTEYYLDWKNSGARLELDRLGGKEMGMDGKKIQTQVLEMWERTLTQSSVGGVSTYE